MKIEPIQIEQSGPGVDLSNQPEGLSIKMSDPVKDFAYARNAVTLVYDLTGFEHGLLAFAAMEFGDEPHEPPPSPFTGEADFDGVAVSADGPRYGGGRPGPGLYRPLRRSEHRRPQRGGPERHDGAIVRRRR
jgi:hypothetical protein